MRWLFGLLLLANLVLYLWSTSRPSSAVVTAIPPATVAGVPSLVLVGERDQATPVPVAAESTPSSAPSQESVAVSAPAETRDEPRAETKSSAPVETAQEMTQPSTGNEDTTRPQRDAEPEPTSVTTTQAASPEPEAAPATAFDTQAAPAEPEPEPAPEPVAVSECARIGPFEDEERARAASRDLAAQRVYVTLSAEGEARDPRYIVYLPATSSRAAALEKLRELKANGIDSFIMGGDFRNAISLGVFSQAESAQRLMASMERRGYQTRLYSQERETQVFWLELGPKNTERLSQGLLTTLAQRYLPARYEARPCP